MRTDDSPGHLFQSLSTNFYYTRRSCDAKDKKGRLFFFFFLTDDAVTDRSEAFPEGTDLSNVDRETITSRSCENEITSLVDSGCRVASVTILAIRTNRSKIFLFVKAL